MGADTGSGRCEGALLGFVEDDRNGRLAAPAPVGPRRKEANPRESKMRAAAGKLSASDAPERPRDSHRQRHAESIRLIENRRDHPCPEPRTSLRTEPRGPVPDHLPPRPGRAPGATQNQDGGEVVADHHQVVGVPEREGKEPSQVQNRCAVVGQQEAEDDYEVAERPRWFREREHHQGAQRHHHRDSGNRAAQRATHRSAHDAPQRRSVRARRQPRAVDAVQVRQWDVFAVARSHWLRLGVPRSTRPSFEQPTRTGRPSDLDRSSVAPPDADYDV